MQGEADYYDARERLLCGGQTEIVNIVLSTYPEFVTLWFLCTCTTEQYVAYVELAVCLIGTDC